MNEDSDRSQSGWYSDRQDTAPEDRDTQPAEAFTTTPPPPQRPAGGSDATQRIINRSKRRSGLFTVVGICLGIVLLIVLSALVFSDDSVLGVPEDAAQVTPNEDGVYDDFRDFFENYYTNSDSVITGQNTLERAPTGTGVTLEYTPASGGELTLREIYDKCSPSVVAIAAYVGNSGYNWGTGIIMTEDGYILTNTHVLDGSSSVTVTDINDTQYEAKLVGCDASGDVAVLKVEANGLAAAVFADSNAIHVGDKVVAIGNPLGEELRGTMTDGIISAISRDISYNNRTMTLLQTNAAINEGNSGGPLINMYGQVIGITNMKMMSSSFSTIEGIGFAIPTDTMRGMVNSIIANGKVIGRPAIGITVGSIPPEAMEEYQLPAGLYVSAVSEGSDAKAKGVAVGDVITEVNDKPVTVTGDVSAILADLEPGDSITLTIFRGGETFDVEVLLVEVADIY